MNIELKEILDEVTDLVDNDGNLTKDVLIDYQSKIIKLASPNGILRFAKKVKNADIELLENALIKIPNSNVERIIFAITIPNAKIMKLIKDIKIKDLEEAKETIKKRAIELGFDPDEFYELLSAAI